MDLSLDGRVVLVTGGSSGVGLATLRALQREGARLATCARDGDRLDRALREAGIDDCLAMPCDVRDPDRVAVLVDAIHDRFGRLDGLVNNAGQSRMKGLFDATLADWHDELDLKFAGVLNPTMAALPLLREAEAASVVNLNAILAVQPEPRLVTTSAARAGLLNLSRSMASELAPLGIRVNSVCLGLVDTGQWSRRHAESGSPLDYEQWQAELARDRDIPLGRIGRADEVASVIAFLLSPASSYVTGSAIDIGGGVNRAIH